MIPLSAQLTSLNRALPQVGLQRCVLPLFRVFRVFRGQIGPFRPSLPQYTTPPASRFALSSGGISRICIPQRRFVSDTAPFMTFAFQP